MNRFFLLNKDIERIFWWLKNNQRNQFQQTTTYVIAKEDFSVTDKWHTHWHLCQCVKVTGYVSDKGNVWNIPEHTNVCLTKYRLNIADKLGSNILVADRWQRTYIYQITTFIIDKLLSVASDRSVIYKCICTYALMLTSITDVVFIIDSVVFKLSFCVQMHDVIHAFVDYLSESEFWRPIDSVMK